MIDGADVASVIEPPRASRPSALRRPFYVVMLCAHRLIAGLLVAAPIAGAASARIGAFPRGDAELFDAGALMLSEVARLSRPLIAPLAISSGLVALVAFVTGFFPLAALIAALGREGKLSPLFVGGRAVSSFSTLVLLAGAALFAEATFAALVVLLGEKVIELSSLSVRASDAARVVVACLAALVLCLIGLIHDLARVAAVHEERRFYAASARAFGVFGSTWRRASWSHAWRGALSIATIVGAAWLARRAAPESSSRVALSVFVHQAAIFAVVALRASWLAAAIALVNEGGDPAEAKGADELHKTPNFEPDPPSGGAPIGGVE